MFIAGRLEDAALDIYMGMSEDDQKDPENVTAALLNNFDLAQQNREIAVEELMHRKRLPEEKIEVFAYKILELTKYAYPKFNDATKGAIAKDYFVKGLHADLQKELRKLSDYDEKTLTQLTEMTTYLEIAGINSNASKPKSESVGEISSVSNLEMKLDRLMSSSLKVNDQQLRRAVMKSRAHRQIQAGYFPSSPAFHSRHRAARKRHSARMVQQFSSLNSASQQSRRL